MSRPPVQPTPSAFARALAWFRERVPMTDRQAKKLDDQTRRRAFRVAHVEQLHTVTAAWKSIARAQAEGESFSEWKKKADEDLGAALEGKVPNVEARLELVFRNANQTALNAGRYSELSEPAVLNVRPWWEYVAILGDGRTTEICSKLGGSVVRADSSWWKTHWPPCHHGCRSGVRSLRESQGVARGGQDTGPAVAAAPGFGIRPDIGDWIPDVSTFPAPLRRAFHAKSGV